MNLEKDKMLFDRYVIKRLLGEGFFGRVYLAHDVVLGRDIAIKELKSRFLKDPRILKRFEDDARVAASLGHRNIVTVFNLEPTGKPQFIMMEYLPNGTLEQRLGKLGKLSIQETIEVGTSLCRALKGAHDRKIVHRDIKPGNILLGDENIIKLADFGIAHLPEKYAGTWLTHHDGSHPHPCTPPYASPEQVRGEPLDGRSDLYTVGVVLYELVTGSFYFDRSQHGDVDACFDAVLHHNPVSPKMVNRDVPQGLDEVIMRLLQKDRNRRYSDASALLKDLEEVLPSQSRTSGTVKPFISSMNASAQRETEGIRYRIRVEAENRGNKAALWSGLTINLPCISSRDTLSACDLNVLCSRKGGAVLRAPGDTLQGFRSDGTFGEMQATCLLVETPATSWNGVERLSLEVSFLLQRAEAEMHTRIWATWQNEDGREITNGDPDWSAGCARDQQGIPTHRILFTY